MVTSLLLLLLTAPASPPADPVKFEVLAKQLDTFLSQNDDAKSFYALQELERTDPDLFAINNYPYLAGLVADRLGHVDVAVAYLTRAQGSRELSEYATWQLAQISARRGLQADRRAYLDRLLAHPSSVFAADAAYERAQSFLAEGGFQKALDGLSSPRLAGRDLTYEKVKCLLGLGRSIDARNAVTDALRRSRRSDGVTKAVGLVELEDGERELGALSDEELKLRGDLYFANRNFDRALFYYRMLNEERHDSSDSLLYAIGRSLDLSGEKAEALEWFERAEQIVGPRYKYWTIWFQAEILFKRQDLSHAEDRYRRALPLVPGSEQDLAVRLRILTCQEVSGQKDRALDTMKSILQIHSSLFLSMKFRAVKALVAEGKHAEAIALVGTLLASQTAARRPELLFWEGWLLEQQRNPVDAIRAYDSVLRQSPRSFHALLASGRLAAFPPDPSAYREAITAVDALVAAKRLDEAKKTLSYLLLRYPASRPETARELADVYSRLPKYRDFLTLQPLPRRAVIDTIGGSISRSAGEELAFLGCYADAAREMDAARGRRLGSLEMLLTIADYYQRGGNAYMAMLRSESLAGLLPRDYEFDLLPRRFQELLYPLNFTKIVDKYAPSDLDLALFFSLVREESRFNIRARSPAGARGLLQFIPSTAGAVLREVGGSNLHEEDLYDPEVSIRLGAYYITKLARQFSPDIAPLLASYNAGEEQGKLWLRMAGTGEMHRYLTEVNYPETRAYIERIMTSYFRYRFVYPELSARRGSPASSAAQPTGVESPTPHVQSR